MWAMTIAIALRPGAPAGRPQVVVAHVIERLDDARPRKERLDDLVLDDLHELRSTEAVAQVADLLANLPAGVRAIVATRHDSPLRVHQLRLAGELAEIRAARLRFTEDETRQLLSAAGVDLPDDLVAMLHQRTEGWAAGLRLAALSLAGHSNPARFVAYFSGSDRTVAEY
jgi:LuxR family maltose regulon positive regulatory protein